MTKRTNNDERPRVATLETLPLGEAAKQPAGEAQPPEEPTATDAAPDVLLKRALIRAQSQLRSAAKTATNPHFRNRYATLADIWDAARDALRKNGLAVLQPTAIDEAGRLVVETTIIHDAGASVSCRYPVLCRDAENPQAVGSAMTYARRYSLASFLGIVADDDDDGNGAAQGQGQSKADYEEELGNALRQLRSVTSRAMFEAYYKALNPRFCKDDAFMDAAREMAQKFPKQTSTNANTTTTKE